MGSSLFMGGKYMGDLILMLIKSIIYIQDRTSGITENSIHSLLL
jgi:hypothetical protein